MISRTPGEHADPEAFARLELALTESSRLLRSTVAELHPAVLEHAGLARALRELADSTATAGRLGIAVELDGWSDEFRYPGRRSSVRGGPRAGGQRRQARRRDLGDRHPLARPREGQPGGCRRRPRDRPAGSRAQPRTRPHRPGVHRARIEAAGGTLSLTAAHGSGTIALVELPCTPRAPASAHPPLPRPPIRGQRRGLVTDAGTGRAIAQPADGASGPPNRSFLHRHRHTSSGGRTRAGPAAQGETHVRLQHLQVPARHRGRRGRTAPARRPRLARAARRARLDRRIAGSPAAALSLDDDRVIADPFRRTDHLVACLRSRAGAIRAYEATPSLSERMRAALRAAAA